jgi:hypothetical protein
MRVVRQTSSLGGRERGLLAEQSFMMSFVPEMNDNLPVSPVWLLVFLLQIVKRLGGAERLLSLSV